MTVIPVAIGITRQAWAPRIPKSKWVEGLDKEGKYAYHGDEGWTQIIMETNNYKGSKNRMPKLFK